MSIALGSKIAIEVTAMPTAIAAEKTLIKLFRKDPAVARVHRKQQVKRPSLQFWRRGGRLWHHQMKTTPGVRVAIGARYTIRATLDVIRELESVKRWVKVSPAK